jgi:putative molybdopterin biosynthesis protein
MQVEAYTAEEVAKLLRVSRQTVYTLIREGKIPHFKVGNKVRIKRVDIEKITNTNPQPQPTGEVK